MTLSYFSARKEEFSQGRIVRNSARSKREIIRVRAPRACSQLINLKGFTYPTVVIVTNAHQNPSKTPWSNLQGNCSGLLDES